MCHGSVSSGGDDDFSESECDHRASSSSEPTGDAGRIDCYQTNITISFNVLTVPNRAVVDEDLKPFRESVTSSNSQ